MLRRALHLTYRTARRIVVTLVGVTVILIGIALIFLPGPATLVIPLGIAILGIEFAWARRWLRKIREKSKQAVEQIRKRNQGQPSSGE
jgi:tellurite resistance protein TerC